MTKHQLIHRPHTLSYTGAIANPNCETCFPVDCCVWAHCGTAKYRC